ncbi:MAG: hypothetical protein ABIH01_00425 [Candidatus Omnitrophota bacterium]
MIKIKSSEAGNLKLTAVAALVVFAFCSLALNGCSTAAKYREVTGKNKLVAEEYLYNAKQTFGTSELLVSEDYCQKLIANFPGTKYAKDAQKLLKRIKQKRRGCLIWLGD